MEHQLFKTRIKMWEYLAPKCVGLDFQRTIRLPMFWFAKEDGTEFRSGGVKEFAKKFNEEFNGNINLQHSYRYRKACVLFFDDVEAVVKEEVSEVVEVLEDEVTEAPVAEEKISVKVDWDWINSLKSGTEDKGRFKKYAKGKFDVELKANQKLEGMIEDFKEVLGL